jgi:gluconate 2-dehydrogenase alpha chain
VIEEFNDDNFDHHGLGFLGGGFIAASIRGRPIASRRLPPATPLWGTNWKRANADWYAHAMAVGVSGSCYPNRENFLDLDPDYTDFFGQPLLRITFDIPENEKRMSDYCTGKAGEIARAMDGARAGPVEGLRSPLDTRIYQSTHLVGGTIMGMDPSTSVVSPRLQHWNAENLFVAGASVFPHDSGHNPTGPAAALSLRLGDDLLRYLARPGWLS